MSILSSIKSAAGSLFSSFKNAFSGGKSQTGAVFNVNVGNKLNGYGTTWGSGAMPKATSTVGGVTYYGGATPASSGGSYIKSGTTYSNPVRGTVMGSAARSSGTAANPPISYEQGYSGGNTGGGFGGESYGPAPVFSSESGRSYASSANVGNVNLEGKTQEEADALIQQKKADQMSTTTANTSYAFTDPKAISNTTKKLSDFKVQLDEITNDAWSSMGTKQDKVQNLLKGTAADIATDYNTPEEIAGAYQTNPQIQKALDEFAQAGGSDQMLVDAINKKNVKATPAGMTTDEYLGSVQKADGEKAVNDAILGDDLLKAEIARTANIPDQLKEYYFGDDGLMARRIKIAEETRDLIREKMLDTKASLREKAQLAMEKNNSDLEVAEATIEQNRVNAQNYITGMLAKLGALQTTGAAPIAVATLNEKYQRQAQEARSKVKFANQEIQVKLTDAMNEVENNANEKINSIKEDLSKDQDTILKEIMKEQNAADKRVFDLTSKYNTQMKKNIEKYEADARKSAEDWTTQFLGLVGGDFGGTGMLSTGQAAARAEVKLPAADQRISLSARIKDPQAIAYFKSLPAEFRNQWTQFASTQPQGTFFTIADLQMNYAPYVQEQQDIAKQKAAKSKTGTRNP